MSNIISTGKYRIYKDITGKAGTKEWLNEEIDSKEEALRLFKKYPRDNEYTFYCEEEVINPNGQQDVKGNPMATKFWRMFKTD